MNLLDHKTKEFRHRKPGNRTDTQQGFTLLETVIALLIMTVAGLGIATLFAYAISYNTGAGDRAAALSIAQQYSERIRKTPFAGITAPTLPDSITRLGRPYTVATTNCGGSSTLEIIKVTVTPQGGSSPWANIPVVVVSQRATPVLGANFQ